MTAALDDGGALAIGGGDFDHVFRSVGRFNPRTGSWAAAAPLNIARQGPAATLLADGRVLVMGGFKADSEPTDTTETYDPRSDRWSRAASLPPTEGPGFSSDNSFLAARTSSGRVLVVGGYRDTQADTWTTYDPTSNTWTARQSLPPFLRSLGLYREARLLDGRVLVISCSSDGTHARAGIYGSSGWTPTAAPRFCGTPAPLPSGRLLYAGPERAYIYNPALDRWRRAPAYRFPHVGRDASGVMLAPTARGAVLVDPNGLNRFSSTERFFEP